MSLLPLIAALFAVPQFLPQLARLRRTGDTAGVSSAWAALTSVNNAAWTAYFALSRLWTALAPSISATLLAGTLAAWLARQGELRQRAALGITGWAALLAVAGAVFGRAALGTALAVSFILQITPSVWKAHRSERISGISVGTWLLILGEFLCWGLYGTYEPDPRLMVLGWTGVAASLHILARVAAKARRCETVPVSFPWLTVFLDFPAEAFDREVGFWGQVTGYGRSPARGANGEFATLLPPSGDAYLRVQRVLTGAGGCHLDLHVDTAAESLRAAEERARSAGARVTHRGEGLAVAQSPGGFTFCLVTWHGERAVPSPVAGEGGGVSRLDTLCLDIPPDGFDRELAFWAALTGQSAHPAPVPGYAYLDGPAAWPVRLLLQRREQADPGDAVRGHVDFGCTDPGALDRHVALGARVAATEQYWTVLNDPAGREYCLVGRNPR